MCRKSWARKRNGSGWGALAVVSQMAYTGISKRVQLTRARTADRRAPAALLRCKRHARWASVKQGMWLPAAARTSKRDSPRTRTPRALPRIFQKRGRAMRARVRPAPARQGARRRHVRFALQNHAQARQPLLESSPCSPHLCPAPRVWCPDSDSLHQSTQRVERSHAGERGSHGPTLSRANRPL